MKATKGLWMYGAFLGILVSVYWFFFRDSVPSAKAKSDAGGSGSGGGGSAGGGGETTNPFAAAAQMEMYVPMEWEFDYLNDGETVTIKGVDYTGTGLDNLTTFERMQIIYDLIDGPTWFMAEQERRKVFNRIASYYKQSESNILIEKYKTQTGGRDLIDDLSSELYYDTGVFYKNMKLG